MNHFRAGVLNLSLLFAASCPLAAQSEISRLTAQAFREMEQGDYDSAEQDLNSALRKARSAHSVGQEFRCDQQLSQLSEKQKDLAKAEEWLEAGLATLEDPANRSSPMVAFEALDRFYFKYAMRDRLIENLRKFVDFWSATTGAESISTARYQMELGNAFVSNKDIVDAEQPFRAALAVFERSGAIFEPAANRVKRELIKVLSDEGKTADAELLKASLAPDSAVRREHPDVMPQLISKTEPAYSEAARKLKISGTVMLSLDVDETGHPQNIRILRPLGEGLDENAIKAVETWVFHPATKGGVPVSQHANVEVSFRLL